ncbi:MAG: aldo/keto reductase [Deltaproteobacteria bacterium]|jgi:predicted aldo/keto reductase-like oxidoreductase|nr:aldo/keto reductase [Deltaproteobacteria bacterium]
MYYIDYKGLKLSALGYGNMRLPQLSSGEIDEPLANQLIEKAYNNGVNYFDTAFAYHNGQSEIFIGKSLSRFPRDTWFLASKFPGYEKRDVWKPAEVFEEQLKKCQVDYFDFYLLHNVYESNIVTYLDQKWDIVGYLLSQKKAGRIRHLGFSTHAALSTLDFFLQKYASQMEFGQLQLNALDYSLQNSKAKFELISSKNIPVWVMEPLRGGKLASFSSEQNARLKAFRPEESIAAWAFRWLETLSPLGVVLSGMSAMNQVDDNLKTFAQKNPLSPLENAAYEEIVASLTNSIPCTHCRYCLQGCPQGLDIPSLLELLNDFRVEPSPVASMAVDAMRPSKRPSACIQCGNCVEVCPQGIDIPVVFKEFQGMLDKMTRFIAPMEEDDSRLFHRPD